MNYCEMDTKTNMAPSVPVERESMKALMNMTNARLHEALGRAEGILAGIRGAYPKKDEEPNCPSCMIDAARIDVELSEQLCLALKEIAKQLGGDVDV